jgi:hypothetical protein
LYSTTSYDSLVVSLHLAYNNATETISGLRQACHNQCALYSKPKWHLDRRCSNIRTLKSCAYYAGAREDDPWKITESPNDVSKNTYAAQVLIAAVSLVVSLD